MYPVDLQNFKERNLATIFFLTLAGRRISPGGFCGFLSSIKMTVRALQKVTTGQVRYHICPSVSIHLLISFTEWRRRFHPAMQEDGLPLLRLGRKLERHEVCRPCRVNLPYGSLAN
jgi:hypothetical protein